jgi:signal peptidase S26 family
MTAFAKHAKKLMYIGLWLIFAAFYFLKPGLSEFFSVNVGDSADKEIRGANFIATRPLAVERGDIIHFERAGINWTQRLIGLPGDVIRVGGGGIFVNEKPIDTTFLEKGTPIRAVYGNHYLLEKGAPIPPVYGSYTVPPDEIVIGTGANEAGAFQLITIDKPTHMKRGELVFSTSEMDRSAFLGLLMGLGYIFLLLFGPILIERRLDPQERWYRPFKFVWYGIWIVFLAVTLFPFASEHHTLWQRVAGALISLDVRFTSLLVYLGATIEQSKIATLITGSVGVATAAIWLWQRIPLRK